MVRRGAHAASGPPATSDSVVTRRTSHRTGVGSRPLGAGLRRWRHQWPCGRLRLTWQSPVSTPWQARRPLGCRPPRRRWRGAGDSARAGQLDLPSSGISENLTIMDWIDKSVSVLKDLLPSTERAGQMQQSSGQTSTKKVDEPLPEDFDEFPDAIQAPGVWRQDPNEIKWALIESKKRATEIMTIKCTLK